jgi:ribosome-associated toxin RatA of RatAB toxin-antitoxin module
MVVIDRSALLGHGAADVYALVDDVESYPRFLPWCDGAQVRSRGGLRTMATIHINFHGTGSISPQKTSANPVMR